jgi:SAM-dependent methyltransferase
MHATAEANARRFFGTYVNQVSNPIITEIGSQIGGNGREFNIRSLAPSGSKYIGIDLEKMPGVDVVLEDPYKFPIEDNSVDFIVSSSCFEHIEFFWLTFLEAIRILKPTGVLYINAPSIGAFHRYPMDYWRFFPDSAHSLSNWGVRNGYNCGVLEQYTSDKENDIWSDYISVYIKDKKYISNYPNRIINNFKNYTNGSIYPHNTISNELKWR